MAFRSSCAPCLLPTHASLALIGALALTPAFAGCGDGAGDLALMTAEMHASPADLEVGTVFIGQTRRLRVTLDNPARVPAGEVTATLSAITGPGAASVSFVGSRELGANGAVELEVRLTGLGPQAGLMLGTLTLSTPDAGGLELPLAASVMSPPSCDTVDPCSDGAFDFATGSCVFTPRPDGSVCDDDNICTLSTVCSAGQCVGEMMACDDGVACTQDFCDPDVGCTSEPVNTRCVDGDACTDDVCSAETGCSNTTSADGTLCHQDGCNSIGLCLSGDCHVTTSTEGLPCDDGDACTDGDTCQAGVCGGGIESDVGATPPIDMRSGPVYTDLCLGSWDGWCGATMMEPETILAAHRVGDVTLTLWRTEYRHSSSYGVCTPRPEEIAWETALRNEAPVLGGSGQQAPGAPDTRQPPPANEDDNLVDNADETPADPPENPGAAPPIEACAAGVFLTVHTTGLPGPDAVDTFQLSSTRGPAAGAFHEVDGVITAVAATIPDERLQLIEADITTGGQFLQTRESTVDTNATWDNPLRTLAVDLGPEGRSLVVGAPAIRQSSQCDLLCDDLACCDAYLQLVDFGGPLTGQLVQMQVPLPEVWDASCPAPPGEPYGLALTLRDLTVEVDGSLDRITLLMEPRPCFDPVMDDVMPMTPVRFERGGPGAPFYAQTPAFYEPTDAEVGIRGLLRLHPFAGTPELLAAAELSSCNSTGVPMPDPDGNQPVPVICFPEVLSANISGDFLEPPATWWGSLAAYSADIDAVAVPMGDEHLVVTRSGGALIDMRRQTDNAITAYPMPPHPTGASWYAPGSLMPAEGAVVGVTWMTVAQTAEDCCVDGDIDGLVPPCDCPDCAGVGCAPGAGPEPEPPPPGDCSCAPIETVERRLTVAPLGCGMPTFDTQPAMP